jgi:hypothetical protein
VQDWVILRNVPRNSLPPRLIQPQALVLSQSRRAIFDEVTTVGLDGMNRSAIARVKRISWNSVARGYDGKAGIHQEKALDTHWLKVL